MRERTTVKPPGHLEIVDRGYQQNETGNSVVPCRVRQRRARSEAVADQDRLEALICQPVRDGLGVVDIRAVEPDDLVGSATALGNAVITEPERMEAEPGEPAGKFYLVSARTRRRPPAAATKHDEHQPVRRNRRAGHHGKQVAFGCMDEDRILVGGRCAHRRLTHPHHHE